MVGSGDGGVGARRRWAIIVAVVVLCALGTAAPAVLRRDDMASRALGQGPTVGERLTALRAERARLQGRADGAARIGLVTPFRIASLLSDALAARNDSEGDRLFDSLPAGRRQAFAELDQLNATLADALARPGEGAIQVARAAAGRASAWLEQIAGADDLPVVLLYTPRFVPPRRATGELNLQPRTVARPADGRLRAVLRPGAEPVRGEPPSPTVPRYAPSFAAASDRDPPVIVEVFGLRLGGAVGTALPVLTIGKWRGEAAAAAPERLRFAVPREAFATEVARTTLVVGTLALRRPARTTVFELPLVVLPDRPGSFALDQKILSKVAESRTLVSPEILVRAAAGETKSVRRCFDAPEGWRFDKANRRVVVVERLGWQDDIPDATMNGGSVEFSPDESPSQVCVVATAKGATKTARTATIGRFEATLVRDRPNEQVARSGVRALDWREAVRVPIEQGAVAWRLYLHLFDEIDREFDGRLISAPPFLRIVPDIDAGVMVLKADPTAEP